MGGGGGLQNKAKGLGRQPGESGGRIPQNKAGAGPECTRVSGAPATSIPGFREYTAPGYTRVGSIPESLRKGHDKIESEQSTLRYLAIRPGWVGGLPPTAKAVSAGGRQHSKGSGVAAAEGSSTLGIVINVPT